METFAILAFCVDLRFAYIKLSKMPQPQSPHPTPQIRTSYGEPTPPPVSINKPKYTNLNKTKESAITENIALRYQWLMQTDIRVFSLWIYNRKFSRAF